MAYNLVPCDREQGYLMPPSLQEWLPEGDLSWFILDVVGQLDLKEFYAAYREDGWGAAAYDPGMMVGVLLFAYCQGVRSSRRIAWALERDVGFRVVAANQQPDFRTICRFRAEREEALERLFVQVLRLCREAGLVKLGVVALDGTKVAADAALAANRSYATIEEEVRRMLKEAQRVDAEEDLLFGPDGRGGELPQELGRRGERLSRLGEAKARLEEESARAAQAAQEHLAQRHAEEAVKGQKKRGRKPKMVEPTPSGEAKANVTDPDSRVMKTRQGYVQGYNVQAVVSEDQIIVAVGVTQEANDVPTPAHAGADESEPGSSGDCRTSWGRSGRRGVLERGQPAGLQSAGPAGAIGGHHQGLEATKGSAGTRLSKRTYCQGPEPARADGAQAAHETWAGPLQKARGAGGAGVWPDEGRAGLPAV